MQSCQPLRGVIQHYAWGGHTFIPELLTQENPEQQPFAEYWLGIHPKGLATLPNESETTLPDWLNANRSERLGEKVDNAFHELPFLFKVLDVRQMLSIQLHPTKDVAKVGFAREEVVGIPRSAPNRSYRDQNHKPEIMVALTDFWLLHGFQDTAAIADSLDKVIGWQPLQAIFQDKDVATLYRYVMELPQEEVNMLLEPLCVELRNRASDLVRNHPDYWAWKAFQQYSINGQHDRGIFSIYWFNLVELAPGEAIFQGAGIPHAYLEGVNIELMANSDNVLRGGLTPKHIDVPELLANIRTEAVNPTPLQPGFADGGQYFLPPVADFALGRWQINAKESLSIPALGPAIALIMGGALHLDNTTYSRGEAIFIPPGQPITGLSAGGSTLDLFIAHVP